MWRCSTSRSPCKKATSGGSLLCVSAVSSLPGALPWSRCVVLTAVTAQFSQCGSHDCTPEHYRLQSCLEQRPMEPLSKKRAAVMDKALVRSRVAERLAVILVFVVVTLAAVDVVVMCRRRPSSCLLPSSSSRTAIVAIVVVAAVTVIAVTRDRMNSLGKEVEATEPARREIGGRGRSESVRRCRHRLHRGVSPVSTSGAVPQTHAARENANSPCVSSPLSSSAPPSSSELPLLFLVHPTSSGCVPYSFHRLVVVVVTVAGCKKGDTRCQGRSSARRGTSLGASCRCL